MCKGIVAKTLFLMARTYTFFQILFLFEFRQSSRNCILDRRRLFVRIRRSSTHTFSKTIVCSVRRYKKVCLIIGAEINSNIVIEFVISNIFVDF